MGKETPVRLRLGAVDRLSKVLDKVKGKFPDLTRGVRRTNTAFQILQRTTEKFRKSVTKVGEAVKSAGRTMSLWITLPALAAGAMAIKSYADYETALVGVGKTSNIQGEELQQLGDRFIDLSKKVPISVTELLELGKTAAQLGVQGPDNILKFSEVMGKLARATNIVGEEGASDLARFIKVTGGAVGDVDKFASALVELGNTSAATEGEILGFATRMGAATAIFNFGGTQVLGYATALRSVGIEAEAGSSSVQRALSAINDAILKGGQKMQILSKVTGIAGDELKQRFKTDAAGVLRNFAEGMSRVEKGGGDVASALEYFGLAGVRDIQVIGALSKNVALLDEKMKTAKGAFEENIALNREFAATVGTLDSKWQFLKNQLFAVAKVIMVKFQPAIKSIMDKVISFLDFLSNNPGLAMFGVGLLAVMAIIGPMLIAFGTFLTMIPFMVTGWGLLSAGAAGFGATLWIALAPLLIILLKVALVIAAITLLGYVLYKVGKAFYDNGFIGGLKEIWNWLVKIISMIPGLGLIGKMIPTFDTKDTSPNAEGGGVLSSAVAPQGNPLGGLDLQAEANRDFVTQTNHARVDVNVRAPESTKVVGESEGGVLSINRGMAGVF